MNKIFKILKVAVFLILLFVLLKLLSSIFVPKISQEVHTVKSFYTEPKNSLDVVFLGDSAVYRGISPIILWKNHKIASYAYATSAERIWTTYYTLQETLKYQTPKLVVLNTEGIYINVAQGETFFRLSMDNKKDSIVKFKAVTDKIYNNDFFDVVSFAFPILRFHDRWEKITKKDFMSITADTHYFTKGYGLTTGVKANKKFVDYFKYREDETPISENNLKYLNKIVDLCREKKIELLFISIPNAATWDYAKHNSFVKYAKSVNIPYVDFNVYSDEYGLDLNYDTCDGGSHLNVYGAEKLTAYLGEYLAKNYKFEDHSNDARYEQWELDAKKYEEEKVKEKYNKTFSRKKSDRKTDKIHNIH